MVDTQTIIINVAYVCLLCSFMVNHIILIRILSIIANIFLASWGGLFFAYPDCVSLIVWPCVFIVINFSYLIHYLYEKEKEPKQTIEMV